MASFQDIFMNFLWLGLFVLAALSFVITIQSTDNATQPIIEDPFFNESFGELRSDISALEDTSQLQYDEFTSEQPQLGFGSIVLFGIVAAGKTFGNVVFGFFGALLNIPLVILGIPQTLFATFITGLVISLIISAWVLYKLGG